MKTWSEVYNHVLFMRNDAPTSTYASQLWETVLYCAPNTEQFMKILQETIWRCEVDKIKYKNDASFVAECEQKIAGNTELLAWIDDQEPHS